MAITPSSSSALITSPDLRRIFSASSATVTDSGTRTSLALDLDRRRGRRLDDGDWSAGRRPARGTSTGAAGAGDTGEAGAPAAPAAAAGGAPAGRGPRRRWRRPPGRGGPCVTRGGENGPAGLARGPRRRRRRAGRSSGRNGTILGSGFRRRAGGGPGVPRRRAQRLRERSGSTGGGWCGDDRRHRGGSGAISARGLGDQRRLRGDLDRPGGLGLHDRRRRAQLDRRPRPALFARAPSLHGRPAPRRHPLRPRAAWPRAWASAPSPRGARGPCRASRAARWRASVEGSHGANALVPHLLGGDHEVLAGHAELLRELDHLYLRRCHVPLTSYEPVSMTGHRRRLTPRPARSTPVPPPPGTPPGTRAPSRPGFNARSTHSGSAHTYAPRPGRARPGPRRPLRPRPRTSRTSAPLGRRCRHPRHVRVGTWLTLPVAGGSGSSRRLRAGRGRRRRGGASAAACACAATHSSAAA